jgi:Mrp family chromosome partitioning ATPase
MSRINEALKRVAGRPVEPQEPHEISPTIEEYPHEPRSGSDGDNRFHSDPGLTAPISAAALGVDVPAGLMRQCQKLASTLQRRRIEGAPKTVAIVSAAMGEGRTSTLLGLALTLTRANAARVLLVDADLCQPTLHHAIHIKPSAGLTELLSGERRKAPLIAVHPSLHVLLAGRQSMNPVEDLGSERLRVLLEQFATHYDWVLVDTPAMCLLPDEAHLLGRLTDGVVFVIGDTTPFTVVERAMGTIAKGCILGTVLKGLAEPPSGP